MKYINIHDIRDYDYFCGLYESSHDFKSETGHGMRVYFDGGFWKLSSESSNVIERNVHPNLRCLKDIPYITITSPVTNNAALFINSYYASNNSDGLLKIVFEQIMWGDPKNLEIVENGVKAHLILQELIG